MSLNEQLYAVIKGDPVLTELAAAGSDALVCDQLNAINASIQILRPQIPADFLRALAIACYQGAVASGDSTKVGHWTAAVQFASGFTDPIDSGDPILQSYLATAAADGVLSTDILNHYTKRPGSLSEQHCGRMVTLLEVSESLLADRDGGQV